MTKTISIDELLPKVKEPTGDYREIDRRLRELKVYGSSFEGEKDAFIKNSIAEAFGPLV